MNWQSVIVDVAVLATACVLWYLKAPEAIVYLLIGAVCGGRLALQKPPSGPGGGALGASGAGAIFLGALGLLHRSGQS